MIANAGNGTSRHRLIWIRSLRAVNDEADDRTTVTANDCVIIYNSSIPTTSVLFSVDCEKEDTVQVC